MLATTDPATTRGTQCLSASARRRVGIALLVDRRLRMVGMDRVAGRRRWRSTRFRSSALAIEIGGAVIGSRRRRSRSPMVDQPAIDVRRRPPRSVALRVRRRRPRRTHPRRRPPPRGPHGRARRCAIRRGKEPAPTSAMGCVLIDGPRRLAMIVVAVLGLLIGVSPMPVPTVAALVSLAIGVGRAVAGDGRAQQRPDRVSATGCAGRTARSASCSSATTSTAWRPGAGWARSARSWSSTSRSRCAA